MELSNIGLHLSYKIWNVLHILNSIDWQSSRNREFRLWQSTDFCYSCTFYYYKQTSYDPINFLQCKLTIMMYFIAMTVSQLNSCWYVSLSTEFCAKLRNMFYNRAWYRKTQQRFLERSQSVTRESNEGTDKGFNLER